MSRLDFGRIDKLPSGNHRARYLGPDGELHKADATFPTRTAAKLWLTERQAEIARELVTGAGNGAIAEHLGIHVKTVEKHVRGLYRALGVSGRAAAVGRLLESDQRRA